MLRRRADFSQNRDNSRENRPFVECAGSSVAILGKPINAGAVGVLLHRARECFAELLLDEVTESLADGSLDEAEQELIELDLLEYCRPALDRRRKNAI